MPQPPSNAGAGLILQDPTATFVQYKDSHGNTLISINKDGSISSGTVKLIDESGLGLILHPAAIEFPDGTTQTTAASSASGNLSGPLADLPTLATGQLYLTTDTQQTYIGTVTGNELVSSGSGNATAIQGVGVSATPPDHNGELLIYDSVQGKYIPGDPLVQGLFAEGTATAGINPVLISGKGADGNQHDLSTDNTGALNVNVMNSVAVTGTFWPATQPVSGTVTASGLVADGSSGSGLNPVLIAGKSSNGNLHSISTDTAGDVNVNVLNTPAVTLASTTITGSVAVTGTFWQATQPVSGTVAVSGSVAVTGTFFQATQPVSIAAPVAVTGTFFQTTQPISGAVSFTVPQHVIIDSATLGTVTVTGTVGVSGTVASTQSGTWTVGISAAQTIAVTGTFWQATQPVSLASTTITGSVAVTGTFWQATQPVSIAGTVAVSLASTTITGSVAVTGTFWQTTQPVSIAGTVAVSLASTTITGTVAVTQSTSPWVVSLTSTTITGSVAVTGTFWQATQPVSIAGTVTVSGTVTTTPPANASTNITQWDSTALGVPTAYGTAPSVGNYIGVNAFITNTPAVTLASTTITGTVTVVQPTGTNLHVVTDSGTITTVSTVTAVTAITNALPAGVNTIGKVDILGNAGGILDTAKGTQSATAVGVQELKDAGRTPITFYIDAIAGITSEALVTMNIVKGLAAATTGTSYTVTTGKTLRLQSISATVIASTTTALTSAKVRVRAALSSFTVASPIIIALDATPPTAAALAGASQYSEMSFPDGYEIPSTAIIGMSDIISSTSSIVTITLVGYEY